MKLYTFKRNTNNFDDILTDPAIKPYITAKFYWQYHVMLGFTSKAPDSMYGYIMLKYGDCFTNPLDRDFTPVPGRDYRPKRS